MSRTLYDIAQNYVELFELISEPEISEQCLQDTLESLDGEIEFKVANGIGLIKSLQNLEDGFTSEIARLTERKRSLHNRIQMIKDWYKMNFEVLQTTKVQTSRGTMAIQKNPAKLIVDNAEILPDDFKIPVPATFNVDTDKLKSALKDGSQIKGAHLEQGTSIRIR